MAYSTLLSVEKLNSVKRTYLHDCKPIQCDILTINDYWDSLSLIERDHICTVYDLKVIDELMDILSLLSSKKEAQRKSIQMINLLERKILIEITYFDDLCSYLNQDPLLYKFLKSFCLIQNKLINDPQESILKESDIQDCIDSTFLIGKKRILKFKIPFLLEIIETLGVLVDSFCKGEKILLKKRHYSALFSELINSQQISQLSQKEDVRNKLQQILELLSVMFENNLIKSYNKYMKSKKDSPIPSSISLENSQQSEENSFRIIPKIGKNTNSNIENEKIQERIITLEPAYTTENQIKNKDEDDYNIKQKEKEEERQKIECLIEIQRRQEQLFEEEEDCMIFCDGQEVEYFQNQGISDIQREESLKQQLKKSKKVRSYKKNEVESISNLFYLVNLSTLIFKPEIGINEEGDSDEEYYQVDEKENFHYNQKLKDYDIAEYFGDGFKFEPSLFFIFQDAENNPNFSQFQQGFPSIQPFFFPNNASKKNFVSGDQGLQSFQDQFHENNFDCSWGLKNGGNPGKLSQKYSQKRSNQYHLNQQEQTINYPIMPVGNDAGPYVIFFDNFNPRFYPPQNNQQSNYKKNNKNFGNASNYPFSSNSNQPQSYKKQNFDQQQQQNSNQVINHIIQQSSPLSQGQQQQKNKRNFNKKSNIEKKLQNKGESYHYFQDSQQSSSISQKEQQFDLSKNRRKNASSKSNQLISATKHYEFNSLSSLQINPPHNTSQYSLVPMPMESSTINSRNPNYKIF